MANVFDYLYWRDDLSLQQDKFNEVDAVILTRLSYLPFEKLHPQMLDGPVSIRDAAVALLMDPELENAVLMEEDLQLVSCLARGKRFENVQMFAYENQVDRETQTQFSAMTVQLEPGCHYVIYRGTDNTLVGWKEDFNMAFTCPVPAQTKAVEYLEKVAAQVEGSLLIGGHSKGGNLAVYAAACCDPAIRERIGHVYNFDGPGFDGTVISTEGYQSICGRISTYVPQSSVVGMLLEHEEAYTIVHSDQHINIIMQHDVYSWDVQRNHFRYVQQVTDSSRFIDATVKAWVAGLNREQREKCIDAIYAVLSSTNASTLEELWENWRENVVSVVRALRDLDEETRQLVLEVFQALMQATKDELSEALRTQPLNLPKLELPRLDLPKHPKKQ